MIRDIQINVDSEHLVTLYPSSLNFQRSISYDDFMAIWFIVEAAQSVWARQRSQIMLEVNNEEGSE